MNDDTLLYFGAGFDFMPIAIATESSCYKTHEYNMFKKTLNKCFKKKLKSIKTFIYIDIKPLNEPYQSGKNAMNSIMKNREIQIKNKCYVNLQTGEYPTIEEEENNFVEYIIGIFKYNLNVCPIKYEHKKDEKLLIINFNNNKIFKYYYSTLLWHDGLGKYPTKINNEILKRFQEDVFSATILYIHGFGYTTEDIEEYEIKQYFKVLKRLTLLKEIYSQPFHGELHLIDAEIKRRTKVPFYSILNY